jgi:hypothetical protein
VRQTILLGAGLSALSCLVAFIPGVRDPDRPDYRPTALHRDPGEANTAGRPDHPEAPAGPLAGDQPHWPEAPRPQHVAN